MANEGIQRSLRNVGFTMLIFGLVGGLVGGLVFGPLGGLVLGLVVGMFGALDKGFSFCMQHYTVRAFFWKLGCTPLRYVPFLDYCTDLFFLRRIGSGYLFLDRMLLEYFASLSEDDILRLSAERANE